MGPAYRLRYRRLEDLNGRRRSADVLVRRISGRTHILQGDNGGRDVRAPLPEVAGQEIFVGVATTSEIDFATRSSDYSGRKWSTVVGEHLRQ